MLGSFTRCQAALTLEALGHHPPRGPQGVAKVGSDFKPVPGSIPVSRPVCRLLEWVLTWVGVTPGQPSKLPSSRLLSGRTNVR